MQLRKPGYVIYRTGIVSCVLKMGLTMGFEEYVTLAFPGESVSMPTLTIP